MFRVVLLKEEFDSCVERGGVRSREIDFGSKGGGYGSDDGKAKENAQQRDPTGLSKGEKILSSTKCCQIRLGHPL